MVLCETSDLDERESLMTEVPIATQPPWVCVRGVI